MTLSSRRYLLFSALAALATIGAIWVYVIAFPMAFLDSAYPVWTVKQARLRDCAFGDVLILGDSQAEAAIIPAQLAIPTYNLALGGASPIETWHVVRQALRCPHRPRLALYTHGLPAFAAVGEALWKNAARFGAIDYRDLRAISLVAERLHDPSISERDLGDGLRGAVRDAAYSAGFPSVFLGSLLEGNLFRRLDHNRAVLREAMAGSGHMRYRRPPGPPLAALRDPRRPR